MGMLDDLVYACLLIVSIAFGRVNSVLFPYDVSYRKWFSTTFGFVLACIISGHHIVYHIMLICFQTVILFLVNDRYKHTVSFCFGFAYLLFCRSLGYIGLSEIPTHSNTVLMIMTLKMIGLVFEHRETMDEGSTLDESARITPTVENIFHYAFSHAGVLTGPYYKYKTFEDCYALQHSINVDSTVVLRKRLRWVLLYIPLCIISGLMFPIQAVLSPDFYTSTSFLYRVFYMSPIFFTFRMRMYAAFILSECTCINAGMGAYPIDEQAMPGQGPTPMGRRIKFYNVDKDHHMGDEHGYNFDTIYNVADIETESVTTFREALKSWNKTVQYWLAFYVYKKVKIVSSTSVATVMVMLVSSVWHGIHPGYYLSLVSVPLLLIVEDHMQRNIRKKLERVPNASKAVLIYDVLSWILRCQWFSYLSVAFLLLKVDLTLNYWSSVYYIGHVSLPVLYFLTSFVVSPIIDKFMVVGHQD